MRLTADQRARLLRWYTPIEIDRMAAGLHSQTGQPLPPDDEDDEDSEEEEA